MEYKEFHVKVRYQLLEFKFSYVTANNWKAVEKAMKTNGSQMKEWCTEAHGEEGSRHGAEEELLDGCGHIYETVK